ncbi:fungal-specific transcription factor domain-containing protein [Emericellopsis atlantica]|uniref:Fungal-specific transcription factor domain-containing protein n=1 Tax=Emericellopsis atlantica TaxID=2614577 RepID=A0A9P8CRT0_9HYPO|nr:fungal-specific transcription factor domain-containing protein [Emericellopsis atlantica]KAG9256455.1 fungal-specific transcription factor domain-containing protein [Emericellopsis atlantica]
MDLRRGHGQQQPPPPPPPVIVQQPYPSLYSQPAPPHSQQPGLPPVPVAAHPHAHPQPYPYGTPGHAASALTPSSATSQGSFPSPQDTQPMHFGQEHARKKQKRNKPTLSCQECVDRKTKCDRGRPHCTACVRRQTPCVYAERANLIEKTNAAATNGRRITKPPKNQPGTYGSAPVPNLADRGPVSGSTGLLSHVPYSVPKASNVFGVGAEHPFANYWTCGGGLAEVVAVLPHKYQADVLLERYFECVDPVYPMIHRQTFYAEYEHFWQLSDEAKVVADASFIGLMLVIFALGTQFQFGTGTTISERKHSAEFYASASNQALRMFSYLSTASITSIQTMVLITYFLINDNHASDGWAFAGVLVRQAYAMGLHRDPNIVTPDATPFEKQQRRKLWQAVLLQDTFLVVLLSLPPSATHTDVKVEDLDDSSSIALSDPTDIAYIRASWTLANLVQETICSQRSLDMPICPTARAKSKIIGEFRSVYRSFPDSFRSWDADQLARLVNEKPRVVRQTLFLFSNYHHNLMLVHASDCPESSVNLRLVLESAHDAITAFFMLWELLEQEARVWWVFNHRAFLEAMCIGNALQEVEKTDGDRQLAYKDPLYARGRDDIEKMVAIMEIMGKESDVAESRVSVLKDLLK